MALLAALCLCLAGAATALAASGGATAGAKTVKSRGTTDGSLERGDRGRAVASLQRKLGLTPDGVFGRGTERAVKRYQRRKGIRPVSGIVGPITQRALGIRVRKSSSTKDDDSGSGVKLPAVLRRIAECESGGDPTAVSPGGRYRGKYQFSRATWRSVGGSGDPAQASEAEQDKRALKLYRKRGTAPWPNCG